MSHIDLESLGDEEIALHHALERIKIESHDYSMYHIPHTLFNKVEVKYSLLSSIFKECLTYELIFCSQSH